MKRNPIIETRGLTRYFGINAAVLELDLTVPKGCVFAFLGRNGAGKTTTLQMLLGLLKPTRGTGTVLGCDIRCLSPEIRARIGYMTEEHQVYPRMRVRECGLFQSQFFPGWNDRVFQGISDHFRLNSETRVRDLSRGERAGLCLAMTLAQEPELLILDDPGLGLDPVARRSLVESMIHLTRRSDRTILFSTHQVSDVERVADEVAILDKAVLRAACSLDHFRASLREVRLQFDGSPPSVPDMPGLLQVTRTRTELRVTCVNYNEEAEAALRAMNPVELEVGELNLEESLISYLSARGEKSFVLSELETSL